MITRRLGSSSVLLYLGLVALVDRVQARIILIRSSSTQGCYDEYNNSVPCPRKPVSNAKLIIGIVVLSVVLLSIVGFFLFRIFHRRPAPSYQHVPPGTVVAEGVMIPAALGEMGRGGIEPQVPYKAPQLEYSRHQYVPRAPQEVDPSPACPTYVPPIPPPPSQSAATHYGYSAAPV